MLGKGRQKCCHVGILVWCQEEYEIGQVGFAVCQPPGLPPRRGSSFHAFLMIRFYFKNK